MRIEGKYSLLMLLDSNKPEYISLTSLDSSAFADNDSPLARALSDMSNSLVYWQSADKMDFGLFADGKLVFCEYKPQWEYFRDMRVFNKTSELHIWKSGDAFAARLIKGEEDNPGEDSRCGNCVEHDAKLWGTRADEKTDKFIVMREDRGMEIKLPCRWEERFDKNRKGGGINTFLRERLYLEEDDSGCVYFHDRRFCWIYISDKEGKLEEMEVSI